MSGDVFVKKIREYVLRHDLLEKKDAVVLGVSGGADSVALLYVMHELRKDYDLELAVVTVDHGLRAEASEECDYVKKLCGELDIPFILRKYDIKKMSEETGKGTEETGRNARYEAFGEVAASLGDNAKIAVAHNMNDLSETMLFHLFRGTGPKGLCSILPKRGNIIRPLLCVERKEIEGWLNANGYRFFTDKSNLSDDYTRNMIRHNIVDYAVNNINSASVSHMASTAEMLRELTAYADRKTGEVYEKCAVETDGRIDMDTAGFEDSDPYIRKMLYKRCIDELVPFNRDITMKHLSSIDDLIDKSESGSLDLPYSIRVLHEGGRLSFILKETAPETFEEKEIAGRVGEIKTDGGLVVRWKVGPKPDRFVPDKNKYTKCFDYGKIHNRLILRTAREGDYLTVNSKLQKKKLSDYFIDEKIARSKRKEVLLFADGHHVFWVIGHRISEYPKVDENTKEILTIEVEKETGNGKTSC